MTTNIIISIGAFGAAFLGCVQAINVVNGYRVRTVVTSICIALSQLTLYKLIPNTKDVSSMVCFVVFGVLGALASLKLRNGVRKEI